MIYQEQYMKFKNITSEPLRKLDVVKITGVVDGYVGVARYDHNESLDYFNMFIVTEADTTGDTGLIAVYNM